MQNEGGSHERRASTSSRTSERPLYSGSYRKESIGSHPDRPHTGDRETIYVSHKRSRSPAPTLRGPIHVSAQSAHSPVRHSRDARGGDIQVLQYDERERDRAWERDREREREREWLHERERERIWEFERGRERELEREREQERDRERERERERGRQVSNDLNGIHPSRKGELPTYINLWVPVLTQFPQH